MLMADIATGILLRSSEQLTISLSEKGHGSWHNWAWFLLSQSWLFQDHHLLRMG